MTTSSIFYNDITFVKEFFFNKYSLIVTELITEKESQEYGACTFKINGKKIIFRTSKITPTKTGQFVAIWKRNKAGITTPFNSSDDFDFIIISAKNNQNHGLFIFPIAILMEKEIISTNEKEGKRGIRIYPPWDNTTNKQANKTQQWQNDYFIYIQPENSLNHSILTEL